MKEHFRAKMLRIHFIEADRWHGEPLHEAIVKKCRELGIAGATVYRGIEGFGASARIYHKHTLSISKNSPVMVTVIDREEQISKLLPHLDEMIAGGLIAISEVDVVRYFRKEATADTPIREPTPQ
jgi:PII-like signaling protein